MLFNTGLSKYFLAEALMYACYLVNKWSLSTIGGKTLLKAWSKKVTQYYDLLRVFDCLDYYYVKENKLDPRKNKGVFVGFKKGVKSYKIWDSKDKKFILRKDVTFDETSMMKLTNSQQVESEKTKKISQ